jgi:alpha-galactosidase
VFHPDAQPSFSQEQLRMENQPGHSVRLLKIIDESAAPQPPAITIHVPSHGKIGEPLRFSASLAAKSVPALFYRWEFGDGVVAEGEAVSHTFTHGGSFFVSLTAAGLDGIPFSGKGEVAIEGREPLPAPARYIPHP